MASAVFPPKFVGATAGTPGISGLVPPPNAGDQGKFMRGDGTFQAIAGGGDMLAANNLSDVASAATAFATIKQAATTSATGVVELATDGEVAANVVVQGNDARLSDTRTPTDNTVSTAKIVDANVTLAKMANLAQDQFIGRTTASTGVPQTATITAAARTVLDDATVAAMVDTLGGASSSGSGGLARVTSPAFTTPNIGTPSAGTLTNCTGLPTAGIVDAAVTLAKMANLAQDQFIGRTTASTGVPETATITSAARTVLDDTSVANMVNTLGGASSSGSGGLARVTSPAFTTPNIGVPSAGTLTNCTGLPVGGISATGTPSSSTYLRGDGSWQTPGGSGDVTAASSFGTDNVLIKSDGTGKGVQSTGISVDDSNNITGVTSIDATTVTPTTLKITNGNAIKDGNSNELIIFTTTASAVNELTFANAATGGNPKWTASGGDSDIGIDFLVKGAGKFNFLASASGPAEIRLFEDSDNSTQYAGIIAPASIGSSYTVTLPNAASILPIFGQQITFAGPTAARTITLPDAAITVARSDAAQTFTGDQTFSGNIISSNSTDASDTSGTNGALRTLGGASVKKKLYVGDLITGEAGLSVLSPFTTASTTFALLNTTATTINAFGAATTLNIGANAAMVLNFGGASSVSEFRFLEPSGGGGHYTAFKAKAQGASITYTLPDTIASAGQFLKDAAGDGVLSWATPGGSGTVTATGGNLTSNAIVLGAGTTDTKVVAGIVTDGTSKITLGVAGTSVGSVGFNNATSGTITLSPVTGALGTVTLSLPARTDTLVTLGGTETLTAKTLTAPKFADLGFIADANGNELIILDTVTSAVNEVTFANAATAGVPTFTASGGDTNVSLDFVPKGTHITDSTIRYNGTEIGFRQVPQNSQSAAYTTVAADRGKHILHPTADNNARTFTIDSNANVAYPIGTVITFANQINTVSIAITSDTLTLYAGSGTGSTGTRSLAAGGVATAMKVASTSWIIWGVGLT